MVVLIVLPLSSFQYSVTYWAKFKCVLTVMIELMFGFSADFWKNLKGLDSWMYLFFAYLADYFFAMLTPSNFHSKKYGLIVLFWKKKKKVYLLIQGKYAQVVTQILIVYKSFLIMITSSIKYNNITAETYKTCLWWNTVNQMNVSFLTEVWWLSLGTLASFTYKKTYPSIEQ